MTERLETLAARLRTLDQIGDVVGALRAIAAGHEAEAQRAMAPIRAHAETVRQALLWISQRSGAAPEGAGLVLVVGAAQGFSGSYPYRLADAAAELAEAGAGLLVTGRRTLTLLEERGINVLWSDEMVSRPQEIPDLASHATDHLLALSTAHPGPIRMIVETDPRSPDLDLRQVFPVPLTDGHLRRAPPLTTLPPAQLVEGLLDEALFSAVALGLTEGFLSENAARVEAMARAQSHLADRRDETLRAFQGARQETMTTELIELMAARRSGQAGAP
ncbi:MAG: F0F1 ATP synthase subunit gamma [Rhodobacteraceae bacterium]|nr:F0F1 ATP synthase subunit gamma [Paracoccaceae bacterium]